MRPFPCFFGDRICQDRFFVYRLNPSCRDLAELSWPIFDIQHPLFPRPPAAPHTMPLVFLLYFRKNKEG
ncbi:MAG: hypothetical protein C6W57_17085 [Caldibacillus debilis]|nr:MAG: hypothetical protein C6W57_17085 [Caldibacillus debilis]